MHPSSPSRGLSARSRACGRRRIQRAGKVLLRLEPKAIGELAARLERGSVLVSATNGKTTTAAMIAAMLAEGGSPSTTGPAQHDLGGGHRAAGARTGAEGLFEVDEAWLPRVVAQLRPSLIVLGNLFRDQLDRYGEMEAIADRWAQVIEATTAQGAVVLNADDPVIADLGRDPRAAPGGHRLLRDRR